MSENHYVVYVEVIIYGAGRYLMAIRSEQEVHAPGVLCFAGGGVENTGTTDDILEKNARREAREEVGVELGDIVYVESKFFVGTEGSAVVGVGLLGKYLAGHAAAGDPDEVSSVVWLTYDEILSHPKITPWALKSIRKAEALRRQLGWGVP
jgi:8-oxo-dGTP diphosphatase